ncbi:ribonuclease III domain-containing protein [Biscogniauxia sp. FL1348]|nr:ribonuclease III domain-containing protein [Biscogniauxia sp. FL1348]
MSKRSFEEFSAGNTSSLSQALQHADELLRAAQTLKKDLENLRGDVEPSSKIAAILQDHKEKILPATRALMQDEEKNQQGNGTNKSRKLSDSHQTVKGSPSAISVPGSESLTRWTMEDISSSSLPRLEPVLNPALEQAAFTHSGMASKPTEMSYERLEWLGDAYIYLMSSAYIYQTFPCLPAGRCSQLRERLVKNETLSEYTIRYGMDKRIRFPLDFDALGKTGGNIATQKSKKKVLGDVFEAYVAAVILGDLTGLSRVAAWLKTLWSTNLRNEIRKEYMDRPAVAQAHVTLDNNGTNPTPNQQDLNPKTILTQVIGTKGVRISYHDIGEPKREKNSGLPWYTVGVVYDGLGETNLQLGYGSGLSKKEAGANAARKAMENKKLIKRLQKRKEDIRAAEAAASLDYDN